MLSTTSGSACDFITSIIQSFVNKCNNSNSCKLFYLDYKSMLIHKLPQTPYTAFPLDWKVWVQENTVYSAFSIFILWWAMNLVWKPNTKLPIWNHFHSCHPSAFVQVSSCSRDRKCPAGQVCIGEAFSKLAKYKQDSCKWKMSTRNVATYSAIPIPQRAHAADDELTRRLAWWTGTKPDAVLQHNRLSLSRGNLNFVKVCHK